MMKKLICIILVLICVKVAMATQINSTNHRLNFELATSAFVDANISNGNVSATIGETLVGNLSGSTYEGYFGLQYNQTKTVEAIEPMIGLDLIYPTANINATQNAFFNVTVNVSCHLSDCGEINVSLDPTLRLNVTNSTILADAMVINISGANFRDNNYGGQDGIVFLLSGTQERRVYIKYNLSNIPSGQTITSAEYRTYNDDVDNNPQRRITIHHVTNSSWNESNGVGANCAGEDKSSCITWTNQPCGLLFDDSNQCNLTAEDNITITTVGWWNYTITSMLGNEYNDNSDTLSFVIKTDQEGVDLGGDSSYDWVSKENSNHSLIHYIYVDYTPEVKSGLVSTTPGTTPFYTNTTNPFNISLNQGESQLVTFWVNATGTVDTTHEFYVYANRTSNLYTSNITSKWNVTIKSAVPDTTPPTITFTNPSDINTTVDRNWSYVNISSSENVDNCTLHWNNSAENYSMNYLTDTSYWYNVTDLVNYNYTYFVSCNDTSDNIGNSSTVWVNISHVAAVTYGLKVTLLNTTNFNATQNGTFVFSVNVSCTGTGDCGLVNVTLDPIPMTRLSGGEEIVIDEEVTDKVKVIVQLKEPEIFEKKRQLKKSIDVKALPALYRASLNTHKVAVRNEQTTFKNRLRAVYNVNRTTMEVKHLLNAVAFEVDRDKYEDLKNDPNVEKVWIDKPVYLTAAEGELRNVSHTVNVSDVWYLKDSQERNLTGIGIKVAVIDTGINYAHDEFGSCSKTEIVEGNCDKIEYMYDFVGVNDDDALSSTDHGNWVAGAIGAIDAGAINPHTIGIAPNVTLVIYRAMSGTGGATSDILEAMENATMYGVDVISMSFGSSYLVDTSPYATPLKNMMDNGTLAVSSAGNAGTQNTYFYTTTPGLDEHVLAVGSTCMPFQIGKTPWCNNTGYPEISDYSSRGYSFYSNRTFAFNKPDIVAPGTNVYSVCGSASCAKSGTSMAAPIVSGVAALIKQLHPEYSAYDLRSAIVNYGNTYGYNPNIEGGGLVDAYKSVNSSLFVFVGTGKTNMIYFGNSLNSTLNPVNFTKIINISNKYTFNVSFNLSVHNQTGIVIEHNGSWPINLTPNASIEIKINVTLNTTVIPTKMVYGYFNITGNFDNIPRIPWSLYAINTSSNCPILGYHEINQSITLPYLDCHSPDWEVNGVFNITGDNLIFDCNHSTFRSPITVSQMDLEGYITGNDILNHGSSGIFISNSPNNVTIRNCNFVNYTVGIFGSNYEGNSLTIVNNTFTNIAANINFEGSGSDGENKNILIQNNTISNSNRYGTTYGVGVNIENIETNVQVIENNFFNLSFYGIYLEKDGNYLTTNDDSLKVVGNKFNYSHPAYRMSVALHNYTTALSLEAMDNATNVTNNEILNYYNGITRKVVTDYRRHTIYGGVIDTIRSPIQRMEYAYLDFIGVDLRDDVISDNFDKRSEFKYKYYLNVSVDYNNGTPAPDVSIAVFNDNGTLEWNLTTDSNGEVINPTVDFMVNMTTTVNYTNLNVTATKSGFVSNDSTINMFQDQVVIMSLGDEPGLADKGGIIPEDSGNPFFVNSSLRRNPANCTLNAGEWCQINWTVHVNGTIGNTYDFFAYGNSSVVSNQSSYVNVTIIEPVAVGDTCDCSSIQAGTTIDCTENCDITEDCDANNQNILASGDGVVTVTGWVTNYRRLTVRDGCVVVSRNGGFK